MDALTIIISLVIFFILLAFIFSTALLTPIIGKKNLIFVILVGFTVGFIGGAFFIAPIIDDLPAIAASFYQSTSDTTETIHLNISTNMDVNKIIEDTKKIDGVKSVESRGIYIKTSKFSEDWKGPLENRIPMLNKNITSAQVYPNDTIILQLRSDANPNSVINQIKDWLKLVALIQLNYSVADVSVKVESSKLKSVTDQLSKQELVITSIEGPNEDKIRSFQESLPNKSDVTLFCGFLGVITALVGVFIDSIFSFIIGFRGYLNRRKR